MESMLHHCSAGTTSQYDQFNSRERNYNMFDSIIASLEAATGPIVDVDPINSAEAEVNDIIAETATAESTVDADELAVSDITSAATTLESLQDGMIATLESNKQFTPDELKACTRVVTNTMSRYGRIAGEALSPTQFTVGLEDISGGNIVSVSLEAVGAVGEAISRLWVAIKNAIRKAWNSVKNMFATWGNSAKALEAKGKDISIKAKQAIQDRLVLRDDTKEIPIGDIVNKSWPFNEKFSRWDGSRYCVGVSKFAEGVHGLNDAIGEAVTKMGKVAEEATKDTIIPNNLTDAVSAAVGALKKLIPAEGDKIYLPGFRVLTVDEKEGTVKIESSENASPASDTIKGGALVLQQVDKLGGDIVKLASGIQNATDGNLSSITTKVESFIKQIDDKYEKGGKGAKFMNNGIVNSVMDLAKEKGADPAIKQALKKFQSLGNTVRIYATECVKAAGTVGICAAKLGYASLKAYQQPGRKEVNA